MWVLTGDKMETAINIGYSCSLLNNNMNKMVFRYILTLGVCGFGGRANRTHRPSPVLSFCSSEPMEGYEDYTVTNRDSAINALESYIKLHFPHMPKWTPGPDPDSTCRPCSFSLYLSYHSHHEGSTPIFGASRFAYLVICTICGPTDVASPTLASLSPSSPSPSLSSNVQE